MSALTLDLPDHLLQNLKARAQKEQISVEQLIIFTLARQTTPAYSVEAVTDSEVREQERLHAALQQSLGHASPDEARQLLARREQVPPEADLDAARLRSRLSND